MKAIDLIKVGDFIRSKMTFRISIIVTLVLVVILCLPIDIFEQDVLNENIDHEIYFAQVTDNYDYGELSFSEAMNDLEISSKINKLYENLVQEELFEYLEVGNQFLEIHDYYTYNIEFVYGYDILAKERNMNQKVKMDSYEFYNTPINAIQVGKSTCDYFKLNESISDGRVFGDIDFEFRKNKLAIILGSDYSGAYEIGDEIEIHYLFTKFDGEVIGILLPDTMLPYGTQLEKMNTYMIMPFFKSADLVESDFNLFEKVHNSNRTLGLIPYYNKSEYNIYKERVKELSKICDMPYLLLEGR